MKSLAGQTLKKFPALVLRGNIVNFEMHKEYWNESSVDYGDSREYKLNILNGSAAGFEVIEKTFK